MIWMNRWKSLPECEWLLNCWNSIKNGPEWSPNSGKANTVPFSIANQSLFRGSILITRALLIFNDRW